LFSVVNPQGHAILLMPPQIQLGGKAGKVKHSKHSNWTTAEQLTAAINKVSAWRGPSIIASA
jgi:hypothetical protein